MYPFCAKCDQQLPDMLDLFQRVGADKSFLCTPCADALEWEWAQKSQLLTPPPKNISLEIEINPNGDDDKSHQTIEIEENPTESTLNESSADQPIILTNTCKFCKCSFATRTQLYNHERVHKSGKHRCNVCDKIFRYKHALKRHQQLHTDKRPYPCEMCYKTFRDLTDLRRHKFKHSNVEKSFKCPHCDRGFYENIKLNQHLRNTRCKKKINCL